MRINLTFLFCLMVLEGFGQITFQKTIGGVGNEGILSVQQTADGGYIAAGSTSGFSAGGDDAYLIKTDAAGVPLWTKVFGGTSTDDIWSVQQTADGGYISVGSTGSFGAGESDVYLIKTDAAGDTLWTKTYGGINSEGGHSAQQTADGGYIIAGSTNSFGAGGWDIYLIKTDVTGDTLWTKTFGGINDDRGNSVQQTTDGGYIVTGYTGSFGAGSTDVYLIKTDVTGDTTWTKTFGGTSGEQGNSVQQSADGGYIIAGTTNSFGVDSIDVYLIRTDATGNSIWTKTFGGTGKEIVYSVRQTTDGGYIIGGITTSFGAGSFDVYLVKTDATGDTSWTRTFGGTSYDGGYSVQQTTDGGYIIGASSVSFGIGGSYDVYLIKTDANGNSGCNEGNTATIVSTPATIVTSPATIVTSPATVVTTPATIVGSGGVVSTLCNSVGIDKINNPIFSISVSPNPASSNSEITFTYPSLASQSEIVLNNIDGKEVARYSLPLSSNAHHVKLPKLAEGIYVARLVGSSFSANVKFVIY